MFTWRSATLDQRRHILPTQPVVESDAAGDLPAILRQMMNCANHDGPRDRSQRRGLAGQRVMQEVAKVDAGVGAVVGERTKRAVVPA